MLRVCERPVVGLKTAVGFDVSVDSTCVESRFLFCKRSVFDSMQVWIVRTFVFCAAIVEMSPLQNSGEEVL